MTFWCKFLPRHHTAVSSTILPMQLRLSLHRVVLALVIFTSSHTAKCTDTGEVTVTTDIAYKAGGSLSPYESERCH